MSIPLDISSLETLFHANYRQLCTASWRIVQDKEAAEDIVQDVFCTIWEKKESLIITGSLKSYLFKSTINHSLNYIKKARNSETREERFSLETGAAVNTTEYTLTLKETSRQVETALNMLPNACRTVFILSRYEHYSYKEIAAELDISIKTVEAQMTKALKHLRKQLL